MTMDNRTRYIAQWIDNKLNQRILFLSRLPVVTRKILITIHPYPQQ